jgi:hypothetical protein
MNEVNCSIKQHQIFRWTAITNNIIKYRTKTGRQCMKLYKRQHTVLVCHILFFGPPGTGKNYYYGRSCIINLLICIKYSDKQDTDRNKQTKKRHACQ